jgi:hypothetical protein
VTEALEVVRELASMRCQEVVLMASNTNLNR